MITEVFLFFSLFAFSISQDIVFPGYSTTTSTTPFTISEKDVKVCPVNMIAIDENSENICECVSGYVYYPPVDRCFLPYSRGPCTSGYYLAFLPGAMIAECLKNPCEDNSVLYQNKCHKLLKSGPPCAEGQTLIVNEENYEIICQEVIPIVYQLIVAPTKHCAAGSRMAAHGICRQLI